ncbi:MAG: hypothetical protein A3I89_00655 [Candidatus Harrisonbacteria bacterium RIFCSPLOWO2_02_FULL_41_11]|uniref:Peptidase C39 domain-containing protein n=1 Tax=Candidatus Harrisonbacteria bacterium RIFCSPHIGHO2_02_FULL_42_16 TaxID=1798404 RepID=A0A1G1ZGL8_9BACT|nr:MAG: hypothetical protein A3B92_00875 [Candidatus Harrisonbacteria bacterium RIFCSPHIGHO2_02_FULL_42_16]OGY67780.1 MAG: hypothetical protein A3I89_00655 [Candidatus Harrisonbacteria bacterium RIFCSPLOWO2_02_FULL_41_11]
MIYANFLVNLITGASLVFSSAFLAVPAINVPINFKAAAIPKVPFYSQFSDISSPKWQKVSCGIASLAMLIEFYRPGAVSVNELLNEGISSGAFIYGAGWSHNGLVSLAKNYGLTGNVFDLSNLDATAAFVEFKKILENGPVIASVRYKFEPQNPIPHLVVINGIDENTVYFNDPAGAQAGGEIAVSDFLKSWKKRFIAIRA